MKRALVLIGCAVLLAGCGGTAPREIEEGEYDPTMNRYYRDTRTQVCFAVIGYTRKDTMGREASGLTHAAVPCTNEVMALIKR
jgi:hypothetical protein